MLSPSLSLFSLLLLLSLLSLSLSWSINHRITKAINGSYYMIESDETVLALPDEYTALRLFRSLNYTNCSYCSSIPTISEESLSKLKPSPRPTPTLQIQGWESPDEALRVFCQEMEYLEYPWYWKETVYLGEVMNPSIVRWYNKSLLIYRISYSFKLTVLAWLKEDMSGIDYDMTYLGIKTGYRLTPDGNQEDPRGYVMKNNTLIITYVKTFADKSYITYVTATVVDGVARFTPSVYMWHPNYRYSFSKNWVPFESRVNRDNKLYYYQFLNPPDVITEDVPFPQAESSKVTTIYGIDRDADEDYIDRKIDIPWRTKRYGNLRGGTPAIYVRGNLLTFFHTQIQLQAGTRRHTYFMGAALMSSKPPFNILKTSRVPIMKYGPFYTDRWVYNVMDYVVFPAGILVTPDKKHIWVSFGYQDGRGYMMKLEIDGLLSSLHQHSEEDEDKGFVYNITRGHTVDIVFSDTKTGRLRKRERK